MQNRNDSSQASPPAGRLGVRERRLRLSAIWGASVLAVVFMASTAAIASGADALGPFKFSGQVTGIIAEPLKITEKLDGASLPAVGCQVQQSSTPEDLIHFPVPSLKDGGKAVSDLEITTEATKYANKEQIATDGAQVVVTLSVGTKNSEWTSTSGTLEMQSKGLAGSFNVGLIPAGKAPGGNPVMSGGATKPIHVSGSWSDCRPWPSGA